MADNDSSERGCPKCGGQSAKRIVFDWVTGWIGPLLFPRAKCDKCGKVISLKRADDRLKIHWP